MADAAPNSNFSSKQETKNFVTPFAFNVHESLLGMRLASPRRRLLAITLDMLFISLLTKLDSLWLSALILIVVVQSLYRTWDEPDKLWAKVSLLLVGIVAALVIGSKVFIQSFSSDDDVAIKLSSANEGAPGAVSVSSALVYKSDGWLGGYKLSVSDLKDENGQVLCAAEQKCDSDFFGALTRDLADKDFSFEKASGFYLGVREMLAENERLDSSQKETELASRIYQQLKDGDFVQAKADSGQGTNSVIAWIKGAMGDLGLSFGWAALYFSVLTAWWNGQTLGKRLLGLKVVRIDGKSIDLWESIGRYGGYSAGLGTGLLGFLQIYWDANRQAIQDKISETLVVQP